MLLVVSSKIDLLWKQGVFSGPFCCTNDRPLVLLYKRMYNERKTFKRKGGASDLQDFTTGNPTKIILAFAWPMLVGNLFQQFYNLADAAMVGQFVGGNALAAVGSSSTVINFILSVLLGLTTGASIVISQYYGARQEESLKRAVSTSILFLGGLSILIMVAGYLAVPTFLHLLDTPQNIFEDAVLYLRILVIGMVFPIYYNMYAAYLRALGDSKRPLYVLIFSTILNLGLNYLMIVPMGMGVAGAAWATVISQTAACIVCYFYATRTAAVLRVRKLCFDREIFWVILRFSVPAAIQMSMTSLANLTIMRLVNGFGSQSIAGYTTAVKVDQLAIMPISNASQAAAMFIGQNIGAGREDRAHQGLRSSMLLMVGVAVVLSVCIVIFGAPLMSLFINSGDPDAAEIIRYGSNYISIIAVFYVLFALFFAFNGFFRGVGDAVIVMILTITSLVIRAVSAHLLVWNFQMGPEAVAWSIPIGWGLCTLYAYFHYKKRLWAGKAAVQTEVTGG